MVGYYNVYKDNDSEYSAKTMNLKLGDDLLDKVYDIFEHIKKNYELILVILPMKVKAKNILKQKYLMKHVLKMTQSQIKILNMIVEYY